MKLDEARAYQDWLEHHPDASPERVTDWEFNSYFEWV
jgi:hypothetical protein